MEFRFSFKEEERTRARGKLPQIYLGYLEYCSKTRGLSEYTLLIHRKALLPFFRSFPQFSQQSSVRRIKAKDVHDYVIRRARHLDRGSKSHLTAALRGFLRFIFVMGYHETDLSRFVPKIVMARQARYPRGLPWKIVEQLLKAPDRRTVQGKRDYAIILLLSRYGTRPRQVINLKLNDIDWKARTILFRAIKGGKDVLAPLDRDVAEALLSYFKAGRMNAKRHFDEVFLTLEPNKKHAGPFRGVFTYMYAGYMKKIGYSGPGRTGPSLIRHSVACKLLAEKNSIKTIADLYGHRSIESTFNYAKVDLTKLAELALEWPGVA